MFVEFTTVAAGCGVYGDYQKKACGGYGTFSVTIYWNDYYYIGTIMARTL